MAAWVAAGHGFPGGSILRRTTGQEGPTGGLTGTMRMCLHGNFMLAERRHPGTLWMFAFLVAQLAWRAVVCAARLPAKLWVGDLVISFVLFAAIIYIPWWLR
jgi:hypothetical protein